MSQALHPMLNVAVKAARAAGSIINRAALDVERLQVTSKGLNDFVTEVDQAAEHAIIEILLTAYPGHAILAEESGRKHGAKHSDYLWIIDPLDGTTNFIHGLPVYAVSIALAFRGKVEQAVVYDPSRNDLFFASKGRGGQADAPLHHAFGGVIPRKPAADEIVRGGVTDVLQDARIDVAQKDKIAGQGQSLCGRGCEEAGNNGMSGRTSEMSR